jgi:tetratricopeptide (TPR) repeat protein/LysM repeat protein
MDNLRAQHLRAQDAAGDGHGELTYVTEISNRHAWRFVAVALLGLASMPASAQSSRLDVSAVAQDFLELFRPSVSGGFLAGQQAMKDLSTGEAARYFNQVARTDWDNPLLVERAFVALAANGQIDEATTAAERLLSLQPGSELAQLVVATQALAEEDYAGVETRLSEVGQDSFSGITAGILRSWALVAEGRADEALAAMESLGQNGLEDFLVFHRAMMAEVAGDGELALELVAQAFDTDPFVPRIAEAYATMLANDGDMEGAIDVLDTFGESGITHPAIEDLRAALEAGEVPATFPRNVRVGAAEMFHGIGVALARDGSADLALVFLRLALYLDPAGDVIAMSVGELLDRADQHEAANALYDAIPIDSPMKPTAVVSIAQNLAAAGDRDEAIRRLRNIVAVTPDDLQAVTVLGDMLSAEERWPEAAEAYTEALELAGGEDLNDWGLYYVRGIAYERADQWPLAEADFQKALELNPDQPSVLNYLGYSWIDMNTRLDEALAMVETAVAARPQDGYIVDSLGWAFYRLGRMDEAVETLERAVSLLPNDPELNDHLGDAYLAVGREREAAFQWQIATAVDAVGTVRERAAPKIAEAAEAREAEETIRIAQYTERQAERDAAARENAAPETPEAEAEAPVTPPAAASEDEAEPAETDQPQSEQLPATDEPSPVGGEPSGEELPAEVVPLVNPSEGEEVTEAPAPVEQPETEAEPPAPVEAPETEPEPPAAIEETETPVPAVAEPEEVAAPADEVHIVAPGDSLWDIAEARYGNGQLFNLLIDANRSALEDPDLIQPGLRLVLPQR